MCVWEWNYIIPLLKPFRWVPSQRKSQWRSLKLLFAPSSLPELPPHSFCSSHTGLLAVPRTCQACCHRRAFAFAIPSAWDVFPREIYMAPSFISFRPLLKSVTFSGRPSLTILSTTAITPPAYLSLLYFVFFSSAPLCIQHLVYISCFTVFDVSL